MHRLPAGARRAVLPELELVYATSAYVSSPMLPRLKLANGEFGLVMMQRLSCEVIVWFGGDGDAHERPRSWCYDVICYLPYVLGVASFAWRPQTQYIVLGFLGMYRSLCSTITSGDIGKRVVRRRIPRATGSIPVTIEGSYLPLGLLLVH